MFVYIAYGIGILIMIGAGILAWKNSKIIAEQKKQPGPRPMHYTYTVHVTNRFDEEENSRFTPIYRIAYEDPQGTMYALLGRVTGERELKLSEASGIMETKLADVLAKGRLKAASPVMEAVTGEAEKEAVARLDHKVNRSGGLING